MVKFTIWPYQLAAEKSADSIETIPLVLAENAGIVTSCEFCEIGIMHSNCADNHILDNNKPEITNKIGSQKDRHLHRY